jgi:hypothetical protein
VDWNKEARNSGEPKFEGTSGMENELRANQYPALFVTPNRAHCKPQSGEIDYPAIGDSAI